MQTGSNELSVIERHLANGFVDMEERDKAFAVEYITNGFRHSEAAEAIGLPRSSGVGKIRNPVIRAFISYLQEQNNVGKIITQQFVEAQYLEILPMLKGEEEVEIVDMKNGGTFKAKKFHSAEVVSVLRDLGKSSGYIAPEYGGGGTVVNVQLNLTDLVGEHPIEVKVNDN